MVGTVNNTLAQNPTSLADEQNRLVCLIAMHQIIYLIIYL